MQKYNSIWELFDKAHIDGIMLKDLWEDVQDADYMNSFEIKVLSGE